MPGEKRYSMNKQQQTTIPFIPLRDCISLQQERKDKTPTMAPRRPKRSTTTAASSTTDNNSSSSTNTSPNASNTSSSKPALSTALGLSQAQFSSIVIISIIFSHWIDAYRSAQQGTDTTFCHRNFVHDLKDEPRDTAIFTKEEDEDQLSLSCTESDIAILKLKYQTSLLRMILQFLVVLICWSNDSLLKTWNYVNAVSPLGTSVLGLLLNKNALGGNMQMQTYTIAVIIFLTLVTNYEDRRTKSRFHLKEGLYNIVLFGVTCGMSFSISNYVILGPAQYLKFGEEDIGEGGKGLWNLMVGVDYSSVMFVSTFALFYLDELRKRTILFGMGILTLALAFHDLPGQKDIWQDASGRQSISMLIFFLFMAGALIPSFDKAMIKK